MSEILSFAERRMRSIIENYFSYFDRSNEPVSVHAALQAVRRQIGEAELGDAFIIGAIEAYGIERGYVLRFDGHSEE